MNSAVLIFHLEKENDNAHEQYCKKDRKIYVKCQERTSRNHRHYNVSKQSVNCNDIIAIVLFII